MKSFCELDMGDAGSLRVESTGEWNKDNRESFAYVIFDAQGEVLHEGKDLMSGVGGEEDVDKMMASLLDFLSASAEASGPDSDNWDLFPAVVRDWAKANSDELSILAVEMEEGRVTDAEAYSLAQGEATAQRELKDLS